MKGNEENNNSLFKSREHKGVKFGATVRTLLGHLHLM